MLAYRYMCVCVCMRARAHVCMGAYVCVRVRVCVCQIIRLSGFIDRLEVCKQFGNDTDRQSSLSAWKHTCPIANVSTTNLTLTGVGSNLELHVEAVI